MADYLGHRGIFRIYLMMGYERCELKCQEEERWAVI
jgi:hypothetical protein